MQLGTRRPGLPGGDPDPLILAAGSGILDSLEEAGDAPPELDESLNGLTAAVRHKLAALASCWAQLVHKSQTVFQNNAKLEVGSVNHWRDVFCDRHESRWPEEEADSY